MKIINDLKLDFKDVLILPKRSSLSSRSEVNLIKKFKYPDGTTFEGVGIIAANMDSVGTFEMARALARHKCFTALHKHYTVEELIEWFGMGSKNVTDFSFYSLGITDKDIQKLEEVKKHCNITKLCVDVANGYSNSFVEKCKKIRKLCPTAFIMAGNVVTPNMVEELAMNAGVNISKCGIGPGSACTTRVQTGIGYPQLSCILDCSDAAHGLNSYICSDGGCTIPGDVCKAFGANADFVMLGGMLAGTEESSGKLITRHFLTNEVRLDINDKPIPNVETKQFKKFYGMSSKEAQDKHNGGVADYKASEGKCVEVEYKGSVDDVIKEILGGLRSACTYVGARTLKDFPKCVTFIRVGMQENQVFSKK